MIAPEVRSVVEAARAVLAYEPEWSMMNVMPTPSGTPERVAGAPSAYSEFLEIADGFICGPVVLFDSSAAAAMQFYAEKPEGSSISLNRAEWFCGGVVSDEPWFIRRSDGSVWAFPDAGVTWWMSDRFERVDVSLESFFLNTVCGPAYPTLAGASRGDQWWQVLSYMGRL